MPRHLKNPILLVRRAPLGLRQGLLQAGPFRIRCAFGRAGTTVRKREGDGATPVAAMRLLSAYKRRGRLSGVRPRLAVRLTAAADGWCDAVRHPAYNRPVRLPFPASAERMLREDALYDLAVVLDWNVRRRARGLGSAIFLHQAGGPHLPPTEGCIALLAPDLVRIAPLLRPGARLVVLR